jgi:hypothetical protein
MLIINFIPTCDERPNRKVKSFHEQFLYKGTVGKMCTELEGLVSRLTPAFV